MKDMVKFEENLKIYVNLYFVQHNHNSHLSLKSEWNFKMFYVIRKSSPPRQAIEYFL